MPLTVSASARLCNTGHVGPSVPSDRVFPWIEHCHAGRGEISDVASNDRHTMDESGCRDHRVALGLILGNVERCTPPCHQDIDRKDAAGKIRQDMVLKPSAQYSSLYEISTLDQQYAPLDLQDGDRINKELGQLDTACPSPHVRLCLVGSAQRRNDIRIEQENQSKSMSRETLPILGGANSKSPPSQLETASSRVRP